MADFLRITYCDEGLDAASSLRSDLLESGLSGIAPVSKVESPKRGKLGVGTVIVTMVVLSAARAAVGMAFDEIEKALLKLMAERREAITVRLRLENGDSKESQHIPVKTGIAVDEAIAFAMKTARGIALAWLK
jgi:hypothetical protein